jgi:spermidine synthase
VSAPPHDLPPGSSRDIRALLRNVTVCYFLSGALGLIYQILWLRKLLLLFGSTVYAVSTILTVFFGGLALGSWWFGRLVDRREGAGLRTYAALEAAVGAYALLTPWLFDAVHALTLPLYRAADFSSGVLAATAFAGAALVLLPPTIALGGTFPVISRFLVRAAVERGPTVARLYAVNTAGAMAGTLFVYYAGLPQLGAWATLTCAATLGMGIGALCWAFDRHLAGLGFGAPSAREAATAPPAAAVPPALLPWLLGAFTLSGFSAMVYEVAWTRALGLVLGSSIYAFCVMLAAFLGGIALGSGWIQRRLRTRPATAAQFIRYEVVLGGYGLLSIMLITLLPDAFVSLWPLLGRSWAGLALLQLALSVLCLLAPTVLMGMLFPVVSELATPHLAAFGRGLGNVYALNTFGGILGSALSGFLLIPLWGLPWTIAIGAFGNLLAGAMVLARGTSPEGRGRRWGLAAASLAASAAVARFVVIPLWQPQVFAAGAYLNPQAFAGRGVARSLEGSKLLFYRDGLNATVSVHQNGEDLTLKVGGKPDASTGVDMGTQVLSAHLPLLLHGRAERVLVIGLGSGVTLGRVGRHGVATIHGAEIEGAVVEAARYFRGQNDRIHEDPRARIFVADGRNFLLAAPAPYDVIISEPSNPWMAGVGYLFTQEFYELAKRRLAPGGLMCQWLQLYTIFPTDVKLILRTFHEAFPHVSVWSPIPGDLLLIGSAQPHAVPLEELGRRMAAPGVRESLEAVQVGRPEVLAQLFRFGERRLELLTADAPWIHRDDQPFLEFNAPRALYAPQTFQMNYDGLARFAEGPEAIVPGYVPPADAGFHRAMARFWRARDWSWRAEDALRQVVRLAPEDPDAWADLGEWYLDNRRELQAQRTLAEAAARSPSQRTYRLLGRLACGQGRLEEASRWWHAGVALGAPGPRWSAEIGGCLLQQRRWALAAEAYRAAVSQGAGDQPDLLGRYAMALREVGALEEAERVLQFALWHYPDDGGLALQMGETLLSRQRAAEAEPWLRRAVAIAPRSAAAYYGLARAASAAGRREEAQRVLRKALQLDPYHREALQLLDTLAGPPATG